VSERTNGGKSGEVHERLVRKKWVATSFQVRTLVGFKVTAAEKSGVNSDEGRL